MLNVVSQNKVRFIITAFVLWALLLIGIQAVALYAIESFDNRLNEQTSRTIEWEYEHDNYKH